jgi:hypothetical protein
MKYNKCCAPCYGPARPMAEPKHFGSVCI